MCIYTVYTLYVCVRERIISSNYTSNQPSDDPEYPRDEKGGQDFENIDAIRLDLFNRHLTQVLLVFIYTHTHTHAHTHTHLDDC